MSKQAAVTLSMVFILCVASSSKAEPQTRTWQAKDATVQAKQSQTGEDILYKDWLDQNRSRSIPVKLYLPPDQSSSKGSKQTKLLPIVVFSHGLGGSREAAEYLGKFWSEHGYLGVFIQHPGSDTGVWKPSLGKGKAELMGRMQAAANGTNLLNRAEDVKFVLDQLEVLNKSDPLLKGKLDLSKIALAGHSFGAGTALAVAGQNLGILRQNPAFLDRRIKSAIYLSPPVTGMAKKNPEQAYGSIKIPGMLMTGTEDYSPIGSTSIEERRIPFDAIKAPHQYLINFIGADHAAFGGRSYRAPKNTDAGFHEMIELMTLKFLNATLYGDENSWDWLDKGAAADYLAKKAEYQHK